MPGYAEFVSRYPTYDQSLKLDELRQRDGSTFMPWEFRLPPGDHTDSGGNAHLCSHSGYHQHWLKKILQTPPDSRFYTFSLLCCTSLLSWHFTTAN